MNKKIIVRYIFIYIPFVLGMILFCFGVINIISSLLLFIGGYIAIKNTFDYRVVKKNIENFSIEKETSNKCENGKEISTVNGIKKVKRNIRVRKKKIK